MCSVGMLKVLVSVQKDRQGWVLDHPIELIEGDLNVGIVEHGLLGQLEQSLIVLSEVIPATELQVRASQFFIR